MPPDASVLTAELAAPDGPGEDRCLIERMQDGTIWAAVIDGASGDANENVSPSGGDYADALCAAIRSCVRADAYAEPQSVLRQSIEKVVHHLALPTETQPSAAVALVRSTAAEVVGAILGDVSVVLFSRGGSERLFCDDRLRSVAGELRDQYRSRLRAGSGFDARHYDLMRQLREEERIARNTPDGYYIAADDPSAAGAAVLFSAGREVERVMLASDGAAAAVRKYSLVNSWTDLVGRVVTDGPEFCQSIRAAEFEDAKGTRWPRSKVHDDIAVIIIERP